MAVGDVVFLGHTTDSSNWELARVKSVSGTTIIYEEATLKTHDNSARFSDQAEMIYPAVDLTSYVAVRAVCDNASGGQSVHVQVVMTTFDSLASA